MQTYISTHHRHPSETESSLGRRRGHSDLARFSLDLAWGRAELERAARAREYPSPPMSESPPLPPKPPHEAGGWTQGSRPYTSHDGFRGPATTSTIAPASASASASAAASPAYAARPFSHPQPPPPPTPPTHARPYPSYSRPEDTSAHLPAYLPQPPLQGSAMPAYPPYLPPLPGPGSMQQGYPVLTSNLAPPQDPSAIPASLPAPPGSADTTSAQPLDSPKSQRKTKGHVASACVPCKRAHLRCDAQRPCSRCLSNGKEDACIDVQHKKRGRPRLREERDLRYDLSGRGDPTGHPVDLTPPRGPIPMMYGQPASAVGSGYGVPTRRGHSSSYRVLKSQPADYVAPRFIERGSLADINAYPPPLSTSTRMAAPVAYLTMDLDISKASTTFAEAVGRQAVSGVNLADLVVSLDRAKVQAMQRKIHDERQHKDPQYLPPIFAQPDRERILQSLGFGPDDVARFSLDWQQEYVTFFSSDGQQRTLPVQLGLAKQDSIYFVVLLLRMDLRPLESPQPREMPYSPYASLQHPQHPQHPQHSRHSQHSQHPQHPQHPQHTQHTQHPLYAQPTPTSTAFDLNQGLGSGRHTHPPPGPAGPVMSPGIPSAYSASPGRPDYSSSSSYQTPRSELGRSHPPPPPSSYQLPPIRGQHNVRSAEVVSTTRDDKTRVDIGGLIDKPEPSNKGPGY